MKYFYLHVDHLSDRGYQLAIEVYKIVNGKPPQFIGGDYKIQSGSWAGGLWVANRVIYNNCKHKLKKGHNSFYNDCFADRRVKVCELGSSFR